MIATLWKIKSVRALVVGVLFLALSAVCAILDLKLPSWNGWFVVMAWFCMILGWVLVGWTVIKLYFNEN